MVSEGDLGCFEKLLAHSRCKADYDPPFVHLSLRQHAVCKGMLQRPCDLKSEKNTKGGFHHTLHSENEKIFSKHQKLLSNYSIARRQSKPKLILQTFSIISSSPHQNEPQAKGEDHRRRSSEGDQYRGRGERLRGLEDHQQLVFFDAREKQYS